MTPDYNPYIQANRLKVGDAIDSTRIVGPDGEPVGLGLNLDPRGTSAPSMFQSFEDVFAAQVQDMTVEQLTKLAQDPAYDGRKKFDPSYIADQKSHGSCNGYAGARALTRARVRRNLPKVLLSGAYLYSLMNGGRDEGSFIEDGVKATVAGCATEATVNWDQIYPSKYDRAKAQAEAAKYKALETDIYTVSTAIGFLTGLALGFDGVCAVHVQNRFMRLGADGIAGVDAGPGNHAVGCDGITYAGGQVCGTGFNSWNLQYGDQGRMLLSPAHWAQTLRYTKFYLIRSTTGEDPLA